MNYVNEEIFVYDQDDFLVGFTELDQDGKIWSAFSIKGKTLQKIHHHVYRERRKTFIEEHRALITFKEECVLSHIYLDKESRVVATKKHSNKLIDPPTPVQKIYKTDDLIHSFTVDVDLVEKSVEPA